MEAAYLDLGVVRDGGLPLGSRRNCDFKDAKVVLLHGV